MPRPKSEESFRLFKRRLGNRELFYVRFLDEEGTVIATRSTETSDERKAVRKVLEIPKPFPSHPSSKIPCLSTFYCHSGKGKASMSNSGRYLLWRFGI
jgi:hypothetical protein